MNSKAHNILICDDDQLIVNVVALSLDLAGYSVSKSMDGVQGLSMIKQQPGHYDLLIVDHIMPNLDGLGFVRELRKWKFTGKIVVLSGHLDDQVQEEYRKLSVEKIMAKPYKMDDLLNNVAGLLAK